MKTPVKFTFLIVLIMAIPAIASAQSSRITTGEKVRIKTTYYAKPITGSVLDVIHSGIYVNSDHGELLFAHSDIRNMWLLRQDKRNVGTGFILGAISAGLLSGTISAITWDGCTNSGWFGCVGPSSKGEAFFWGAVDGVIVGGLMGAVIGYYTKTERWVKVRDHDLVFSSQLTSLVPKAPPALTLRITMIKS
jgi:hypothetical protein